MSAAPTRPLIGLVVASALALGACRSPDPHEAAAPARTVPHRTMPAERPGAAAAASGPTASHARDEASSSAPVSSAEAAPEAPGTATATPADPGAASARDAGEPAGAPALAAAAPRRVDRPLQGQSSLYDRDNPDFARLQQANEALSGFPADRTGRVDWVAAIRDDVIAPRADLHGSTRMRLLDTDIIMRDTREMPWVRFPHRAHTEWLDCRNCHDGIFRAVRGANSIDMNGIFRGRHCGVCHDRVSFSVFACERCHSVVHEDSPEAWWAR